MVVLDGMTGERARRAVAVLARCCPVRAAFVFGSRVLGGADEWSDLDLAAFVDGLDDWSLQRRVRAVVQTQKEAGDDLDVHLFPAAFLRRPPPASLAAVVLEQGVSIDVPTTSTAP